MIPEKGNRSDSAGKLLSMPVNENLSEIEYSRAECSYKNLSDTFKHEAKDFTRQFAHIYAVRLTKMRDLIRKKVQNKWGNYNNFV